MYGQNRMMFSTQMTPVVKRLIVATVLVWFVGQVLLDSLIFKSNFFMSFFSLRPGDVGRGFVWQLGTYMFLHAPGEIWHVAFNMLMLWWFGSAMEQRWGSKFFLAYYLICGAGAGVIYVVGGYIAYFIFNAPLTSLMVPVVGASGAIFGIFLAYGIIFGERLIYIFGIFPMKAKVFVALLTAVQLVMLLSPGSHSGVAYLAHLGGVVTGYLFLVLWSRKQRQKRGPSGRGRQERRRKLRLVVNNEDSDDESNPRYWN